MDPIHQFNIQKIFTIGHIGNTEIAFTNSSAYMLVAVAIVALLMLATSTNLVPGRLQSVAEISYEFVANTIRSTAGKEGMKFFPLIFSLFMFVAVSNLVGIIPYTFTVSSHIIITAALAILVIATVLLYGFARHGIGFLKLFVPSGVPLWLLPILVPIEIISFVSRPVSLSVRLFANMLAGHIALKIFAGFVATLLAAGVWKVLSPLPLALTTALTALELLVAFLQAYVFAVLTCVYLSDAVHGAH